MVAIEAFIRVGYHFAFLKNVLGFLLLNLMLIAAFLVQSGFRPGQLKLNVLQVDSMQQMPGLYREDACGVSIMPLLETKNFL